MQDQECFVNPPPPLLLVGQKREREMTDLPYFAPSSAATHFSNTSRVGLPEREYSYCT